MGGEKDEQKHPAETSRSDEAVSGVVGARGDGANLTDSVRMVGAVRRDKVSQRWSRCRCGGFGPF